MRKLVPVFVIAAAASAGAGASAPKASEVGHVWQLTTTTKNGLSVSVQMKLSRHIPGDVIKGSSPVYIYATESILGGGNINFDPKGHGIDATIVMDKTNVLRCFAEANASGHNATGYLLQGTSEGTNLQLTQAQEGNNYSHRALLKGIRRVGAGTCTLKRLR